MSSQEKSVLVSSESPELESVCRLSSVSVVDDESADNLLLTSSGKKFSKRSLCSTTTTTSRQTVRRMKEVKREEKGTNEGIVFRDVGGELGSVNEDVFRDELEEMDLLDAVDGEGGKRLFDTEGV